jgi:hypothetical protein
MINWEFSVDTPLSSSTPLFKGRFLFLIFIFYYDLHIRWLLVCFYTSDRWSSSKTIVLTTPQTMTQIIDHVETRCSPCQWQGKFRSCHQHNQQLPQATDTIRQRDNTTTQWPRRITVSSLGKYSNCGHAHTGCDTMGTTGKLSTPITQQLTAHNTTHTPSLLTMHQPSENATSASKERKTE